MGYRLSVRVFRADRKLVFRANMRLRVEDTRATIEDTRERKE